MTGQPFERIALIGCGLIGSSVARAVRERGFAGHLAIYDLSPKVRDRVRELDLADTVTDNIAQAVTGTDLVIYATPPMAMAEAAAAAAPHYAKGAVISDVGSVKGAIADILNQDAPAGVFVIPGHPIAGTEQSGPDAGFAALFDGRWVILTPSDRADDAYAVAVARLSAFWRSLGAQVELMDARHHDLVLAVTSHLPHLIAYNIVGTAADLEEVTQAEVMKFSAGGFRDFTRIAASDPVMWRDVFILNKDAVLEILGRFTEDLQALSRAIRWGEADKLEELFTRTREIRRGVIALGQEDPTPNFGRNRAKD